MEALVLADLRWGIGWGGGQPVRIPADLRRFRARTEGHAVILGRKTLEALPGGRPLPGRRNLVLSRRAGLEAGEAEVFSSPEALLEAAPEDAFLIGGGQVYRLLLPWCKAAAVTRLETALPADTFFPALDRDPDWTLERVEGPFSHEGLAFRYESYRRLRWGAETEGGKAGGRA